MSQARQICESKELLLKEKVRAARKRAEAAAAASVREERMKTLRKELKDVGNMVMQMSDDVNPKELHALLQQVQQRQEDIQQELAVLVMQVASKTIPNHTGNPDVFSPQHVDPCGSECGPVRALRERKALLMLLSSKMKSSSSSSSRRRRKA